MNTITMPPLPRRATIGELYNPAMKMTDQAEADVYFARLVEHHVMVDPKLTREEAESIQRQNLGYYAGYYDVETRERVERLFVCAHPVFGPIATRGQPTAEEAFRLGQVFGGAMKPSKSKQATTELQAALERGSQGVD